MQEVVKGCLMIRMGEWVNVSSGTGLLGWSWKKAVKLLCRVCVLSLHLIMILTYTPFGRKKGTNFLLCASFYWLTETGEFFRIH